MANVTLIVYSDVMMTLFLSRKHVLSASYAIIFLFIFSNSFIKKKGQSIKHVCTVLSLCKLSFFLILLQHILALKNSAALTTIHGLLLGVDVHDIMLLKLNVNF